MTRDVLEPSDWDPWLNVAIFAASAVLVWIAGTRIAHYADQLAERTGLRREFLGVIVLGGITSLPELAVATTATLQGTPELSVNDVLGSAAINVVILAVADVAAGRDALTARQGSASVLLQGVLGIVLMAMVVGASLVGDVLVFGVGVWSWLLLAAYVGCIWVLGRSRAGSQWTAASIATAARATDEARGQERPPSVAALLPRLGIAALAILVAGFALARTAEALADQTGLGTGFFGVVFLGLSTSLPEVSTVLGAVRLRRYSMAISDVFGTNLFNVTIIVLVDALHPGGPVLLHAGRFASFGALLALVLTAFFVAGLLERRDRTILRMGYDSLAVLLTYACGVVVLYGLR